MPLTETCPGAHWYTHTSSFSNLCWLWNGIYIDHLSSSNKQKHLCVDLFCIKVFSQILVNLLIVLFITVGLKKKQRTKKCHELMWSLLYHCCFMNKILLLVKYAFFLFMTKVGNECPWVLLSVKWFEAVFLLGLLTFVNINALKWLLLWFGLSQLFSQPSCAFTLFAPLGSVTLSAH